MSELEDADLVCPAYVEVASHPENDQNNHERIGHTLQLAEELGQKPCTCNHSVVTKYQKRISGSMLDRIVPRARGGIEVPLVDYEKLISDRLGESSVSIREQVQVARERQRVRFAGTGNIVPCKNQD